MSGDPRELSALFDPASVAVVGATDAVNKWGYHLARGALAGAHRRRVDLVNHIRPTALGRRTVPRLTDLPDCPQLVVVAVPELAAEPVVREALEMGVAGVLVVTAALAAELDLADLAHQHRARLIGPNSLGMYDAGAELHLAAWADFPPGPLAIVSQSGQLGLEIGRLAAEARLGVSRFVSVGNQVDVTAADVLEGLVDDGSTRVVAVYGEGFVDGRRLVAALSALREAGKFPLVLTVGDSDASRRAAESHTGSLTSGSEIVDAACRAAGAVRVRTPAELVDAAVVLAAERRPRGRRLGVVGDSGGQGALAADVASQRGLEVSPLPLPAVAELGRRLPPHAGLRNPVDLAGAGEQDMDNYTGAVASVAAGGVDVVLLTGYFGRYGIDTPDLLAKELAVAQQLAAAAHAHGGALIVHTMADHSPAKDQLAASGVASFHTVEAAVTAVGNAVVADGRRPRPLDCPWQAISTKVAAGYLGARSLLSPAGVAFPPAIPVTDREDLSCVRDVLRPPYVLKADWITHKTEQGAVVVGLESSSQLLAAYDEMVRRLGPGRYVVEERDQRSPVAELIVGARRDPGFGPVLLVGAGGVTAELYADHVVELAPVDRQTAGEMLRRLRCWPLLDGWRGGPPLDVESAVDVIVAVSDLIVHHGEVAELELNPVRVGESGALAVDALVLTGHRPTAAQRRRLPEVLPGDVASMSSR
jgi:acyl-CoA synthetase (NDP forming)